jgi:hypothetical protein
MKITKQRLQRIIQEELQAILREQESPYLAKLKQALDLSVSLGRDNVDPTTGTGYVTPDTLAKIAPHVTNDEQLGKVVGWIKQYGGAKVLKNLEGRPKKAAPPGDAPGTAVDPKVAALQKKAAAGDITSKEILRQYKKQQARKAGGV